MKETDVLLMCHVYAEMNAIRARDGVPYCYDGRKSDVSQEWWDDIMERLNDRVKEVSGKGCWLNPCMYENSTNTKGE